MAYYFADTYALIESLKGNVQFKNRLIKKGFITTRLNLLELFYDAVKEGQEENGEEYYNSLLPNVVEIEDETIKKAAKLRYELKKSGKNVSYIDVIGYQIAIERRIKFITGDKEFKDLENVEFLK